MGIPRTSNQNTYYLLTTQDSGMLTGWVKRGVGVWPTRYRSKDQLLRLVGGTRYLPDQTVVIELDGVVFRAPHPAGTEQSTFLMEAHMADEKSKADEVFGDKPSREQAPKADFWGSMEGPDGENLYVNFWAGKNGGIVGSARLVNVDGSVAKRSYLGFNKATVKETAKDASGEPVKDASGTEQKVDRKVLIGSDPDSNLVISIRAGRSATKGTPYVLALVSEVTGDRAKPGVEAMIPGRASIFMRLSMEAEQVLEAGGDHPLVQAMQHIGLNIADMVAGQKAYRASKLSPATGDEPAASSVNEPAAAAARKPWGGKPR